MPTLSALPSLPSFTSLPVPLAVNPMGAAPTDFSALLAGLGAEEAPEPPGSPVPASGEVPQVPTDFAAPGTILPPALPPPLPMLPTFERVAAAPPPTDEVPSGTVHALPEPGLARIIQVGLPKPGNRPTPILSQPGPARYEPGTLDVEASPTQEAGAKPTVEPVARGDEKPVPPAPIPDAAPVATLVANLPPGYTVTSASNPNASPQRPGSGSLAEQDEPPEYSEATFQTTAPTAALQTSPAPASMPNAWFEIGKRLPESHERPTNRDTAPVPIVVFPRPTDPAAARPEVNSGLPVTASTSPPAPTAPLLPPEIFREIARFLAPDRLVPSPAAELSAALPPVGATALPVAPVAAPVLPSAPVDTGRAGWMEAMIERIAELPQAEGGRREAQLRLAPDALGRVEVRIVQHEERTHVSLHAETPQARLLLAEAAPRLHELAEARGLKLAEPQIGGGSPQQQGQPQQDRRAHQPSSLQNRLAAGSEPEPDSGEMIA